MSEVFKDIPDYEGLYQVSDLGRVKSCRRKVKSKGGSERIVFERILKTNPSINGYLEVSLSRNSKQKNSQVHKLMAIAFLGHKPNGNTIVVDHKNNIRTDNLLDNLQLITHRHNSSKDRTKGSSEYAGVSWHKGNKKWQATIRIKGKDEHLGYFTNEIDAYKAYSEKVIEIQSKADGVSLQAARVR